MLDADTIHYELADRARGIAAGGIGAMLLLARRPGWSPTSTAASTS